MFPNASGDAPPREDAKQHFSNRSNDVYLWKVTHEKWKCFDDVRAEGLFFDVVLKSTDGKAFPAHRIILCACSPYFKSLFSGRWESGNRREISIPGVTACVLEYILQFAYNREISLTSLKETKELLIAANHLGIEEIVHECFSFLQQKMNLNNCLDIWDFSRTYYCHDLESSTKAYILKHIVEIACTPTSGEYQSIWNLSAGDLQIFLDDPELNVCEESLTFGIIVKWIGFDANQRHKLLFQLLLTVRWISLSHDFVENVVKKNSLVQFCRDTRRFIDYVSEQLEQGKFRSDRSLPSSTKRDLNGNFLVSPSHRGELFRKWSTPRFPRSLILVVGGWCEDSPSNSAEIYEPRSKKWRPTNKSLPPILQRPRAYHSVLYHAGYMYVIGGYDGHNTYNSCDRYDMARCQWQEMCGMHCRRCYVGVALLDGCIYAFGGSDGSEAARLKSAEKFYPSRNVWKQLPDMHERRSDAGGCSLGRRVYVAGGFTGEECVFSVECFDVDSDQWTRVPRMAVARSGVSVVAYRGRVVVLGGYDGHNRLKSVEVYDPDANQWKMLKPMLTKRSNFTACVIENKLVVMGGFNGNSTCSDVECFYDGACECDLCLLHGIQPGIKEHQSFMGGSDSTESANLEEDLQTSSALLSSRNSYHFQNGSALEIGRWRRLANMKMCRSALSCCVLTGLPPNYLNSLMQNDQ